MQQSTSFKGGGGDMTIKWVEGGWREQRGGSHNNNYFEPEHPKPSAVERQKTKDLIAKMSCMLN
jgi:hypothetical protein